MYQEDAKLIKGLVLKYGTKAHISAWEDLYTNLIKPDKDRSENCMTCSGRGANNCGVSRECGSDLKLWHKNGVLIRCPTYKNCPFGKNFSCEHIEPHEYMGGCCDDDGGSCGKCEPIEKE